MHIVCIGAIGLLLPNNMRADTKLVTLDELEHSLRYVQIRIFLFHWREFLVYSHICMTLIFDVGGSLISKRQLGNITDVAINLAI